MFSQELSEDRNVTRWRSFCQRFQREYRNPKKKVLKPCDGKFKANAAEDCGAFVRLQSTEQCNRQPQTWQRQAQSAANYLL